MASSYLAASVAELERDWGLVIDDDWQTDVGPGRYAPVIRRFGVGAAAQREAVLARFGLAPSTAKSLRSPASTVNARSETASTRSAFKGAWAERQWCIVPAACLLLQRHGTGDAPPERWRLRRNDRSPLNMAGLWDRWVGEDGRSVVSFAILTINCDLHPLLAGFGPVHNDKGEPVEKRTPVLLAEEDFDAWLDSSSSRAPIYFGTFGKDDLEAEPAPAPTDSSAMTTVSLDSTNSEF